MLTTENHLTLQAGTAHAVATRREDYDRQRTNAAWSAICDDYAAALPVVSPAWWSAEEAERTEARRDYWHRFIRATYTAEIRLLEAGAR